MPFTEAFLISLSSRVSAALLGAVARGLRQRLSDPAREKALLACCTAGVTALLAAAEPETPEHEVLLGEILERFFRAEDMGRELEPLLRAEPLDADSLLDIFAEAGYVSEQLPGLDLRQALAKFEAAFVAAATRKPVLQGEISTRQALLQTAVLRDIRADVGRLAGRGTALPRQVLGLLQSPGPAADALRAAYLSRLSERLRRLPLTGIDPKAASPEARPEVELATVYTALLTNTRESPEGLPGPEALKAARRGKRRTRTPPATEGIASVGTLEAGGREDRRRLSALEILDREPRLALLGEPGSGKTTFLSFVALCLAGEGLGSAEVNLERLRAPLPPAEGEEEPRPQPWRHEALLPVHVVLRELAARGLGEPGEPADGDTLWRFLVAELGEALADFVPLLRAELLERGGLVLLYGLDEVPDAGRRRVQVKDAVCGFAATFPLCRFLVTSRTYAYQRQDWKLPGFTEAELAPFAPFQVRHFVERWYAHVGPLRGLTPEGTEGGAALLKAAIAGSDRLSELARRPLLLTLMASLHAWRSGTLPERREELYDDAVKLLLDQWESPKVVKDARGRPLVEQPSLAQWLEIENREVLRREINRLAFEAHRDQPDLRGTADIAQRTLEAALLRVARDPEVKHLRLVEFLSERSGLLAARGVGIFAFPHRTFQEYLAACHLTDAAFPYEVARLARADPQRWREVALLAGAKAARGMSAAVWLLVDSLSPESQVGPPVEEAWGTRLAGELLVESARLEAVEPADGPKLERVRRRLAEVLAGSELPALERAAAGRALARLGDPRLEVLAVPEMDFCLVPAGPICPRGNEDRDIPYPYWISRFPVTQAQYEEFCWAEGYHDARFWEEARSARVWDHGRVTDAQGETSEYEPLRFGAPLSLPNHPVVGVTWYEALAFARWLTERLHAEGLPNGWEARLPSELEWEKAKRGGLQVPTPEAVRPRMLALLCAKEEERLAHQVAMMANPLPRRIYPWGDDEPTAEHANFGATGVHATSAVGCFSLGRSPYGCEEMAGNVWEWCADVLWGDPRERPDAMVALGGGSWLAPARYLAAPPWFQDEACTRTAYYGFRCVLVRSSEHG